MEIGVNSSSSGSFDLAVPAGFVPPVANDVSAGSEGLSQRALDIARLKKLVETNKSGLMRAMMEVSAATEELSAAQSMPTSTSAEKKRRDDAVKTAMAQYATAVEAAKTWQGAIVLLTSTHAQLVGEEESKVVDSVEARKKMAGPSMVNRSLLSAGACLRLPK
jgi:hypothetical protein